MTTHYDPGVGGWLRVTLPDDDARPAFVRFIDAEGRLVIADVALTGGVDTDGLRRLPLGRIEAWANGAGADRLRAGLDKAGPDLAVELAVAFPKRRWRQVATAEVPVLVVPTDRDKGDDFYRQVAEVYRAAAAAGHPPAREIATAADSGGTPVPASTAHRWIREARRRGYLPPGRVGKAG
ncbi:MAG TPA: hypothetical protein VF244_10510 [Acidimicrobiales bacterium]